MEEKSNVLFSSALPVETFSRGWERSILSSGYSREAFLATGFLKMGSELRRQLCRVWKERIIIPSSDVFTWHIKKKKKKSRNKKPRGWDAPELGVMGLA